MQLEQRSQKGFTLIEMLIATALLMAVISMTVNAIWDFNRSSNRLMEQTTQAQNQRMALNRLEGELMPASEILAAHPADASVTTTKNRIVYQVPLYNDSGFIVVDNGGLPIRDTAVLEVVPDPQSSPLPRTGKPSEMLRLSVSKSMDSTRYNLSNQVIIRGLMPKETASKEYDCPTGMGISCPPAGTAESTASLGGTGTFVLLQKDGSRVDPTNVADLPKVSTVKVILRSESNYQGKFMTSSKEFDFRLRNWGTIATP